MNGVLIDESSNEEERCPIKELNALNSVDYLLPQVQIQVLGAVVVVVVVEVVIVIFGGSIGIGIGKTKTKTILVYSQENRVSNRILDSTLVRITW